MSKVYFVIISALFVFVTSRKSSIEFPHAEIDNGIIHASFYLPDADKGYYRGTRFDWSGVIPDLQYNGHSYCAQWFEKYDPTTHDAIMGPVESFFPLGFDDAKAGGSFVQIGVGVLSKTDDAKYAPFRYYHILNAGEWKVKKKSSSIEFTHTLRDSNYSYQYKKTATLIKGKPILVLTHSLKNTGWRTIETNVFNHNFFVMDHQPTGPDFTIKFPFILSGDAEGQRGIGAGDIAEIKDSQIVFNRELTKINREQVYSVLHGYSNDPKDYDIRIENHKTGAAIRITSDRPFSKLVFWGVATVFTPEPYVQMKINPGETFNWKIVYQFHTSDIIH